MSIAMETIEGFFFFRLQRIKEYRLGLQMYDLCFDDNHE